MEGWVDLGTAVLLQCLGTTVQCSTTTTTAAAAAAAVVVVVVVVDVVLCYAGIYAQVENTYECAVDRRNEHDSQLEHAKYEANNGRADAFLHRLHIYTRSLAVAMRPCDCCVGQFWPNITGRRYFADNYRSIFNHRDVNGLQSYRIRRNNAN